MYSVGPNTHTSRIMQTDQLPLGSFCSSGSGTFRINSKTDSTGTNCANMNLAMDATSKIFKANYPYPNLECTINFKCDADGLIS